MPKVDLTDGELSVLLNTKRRSIYSLKTIIGKLVEQSLAVNPDDHESLKKFWCDFGVATHGMRRPRGLDDI